MVHPMHAKVIINLLLIHLESLIRQNDSINTFETTLNENKGKISVNCVLFYITKFNFINLICNYMK